MGTEPDDLASALGRTRLATDTVEGERQRHEVKARLLGAPAPETRVDRFVVIERLGAGGMGVVYAAYDPLLDRKVAIKLVRTWGRERRLADQQRLVREARALARLAHPHVVAVYEVGLREGDVFIAMEFVRGKTLRQHVVGLGRKATLAAYAEAGAGLAAAHAAGIVHRDFKPDNALVGEDGRVRVLDFGLAHRGGEETTGAPVGAIEGGSGLTVTGSVLGTPAYMAPEQRFGLPASAQSDQFSFCVALHEALTGELPTADDRGRPKLGALPAWLRRAIGRGLANDPRERWPSMDALAAALARDPTRRRRVLVVAAVPIVALGGQLGVRAMEDHRLVAACDHASAEIAAVWNDERRAAIASAFDATGAAYAADSWLRVARRVDAHASSWIDERTAACRAAAVERAVLPDDAAACFEERRVELDRLLARLANADADLVRVTVDAAAALGEPARCADLAWLAGRPPLPSDPELRAEVEAVRRSMIGAYGSRSEGEQVAALAEARAIVARSEALGFAPLTAVAHLGEGHLLFDQGEFARAELALVAAFEAAMGAGDDATAVSAVARLIEATAIQAHTEEGATWARVAGGMIARLQLEGSVADGRRWLSTSELQVRAGRYDEAVDASERARVILEAELGRAHPSTLVALRRGATANAFRGELDEALRAAREAVSLAEEIFGPGHPNVAKDYATLGMVFGQHGEHELAQAALERAVALLRLRYPEDHVDVAFAEGNLGGALLRGQQYARARAVLERALAKQIAGLGERHPDVAGTLINLGAAWLYDGEPGRAIEVFERSVAIGREALGPDHPTWARTLDGLGSAYLADQRYPQAIATLREAIAVATRTDGAQTSYVHDVRRVLVGALRAAGQIDAARAELEDLVASPLPDDPSGVATDEHLLAEVLLEQGELDGAQTRYTSAAQAWLATRGPASREYGDAQAGLGRVALARDDAAPAIELLEPAVAILGVRDDAVTETAQARFALARALDRTGREPDRARELAILARDDLESVPSERAEVVRWLAVRDRRNPRSP